MDAQDYTDVMSTLQPGHRIKVPHDGCSSSNSLVITHAENGFLLYCHKCNDKAFFAHDDSPADHLRRKRLLAETQRLQTLKDYSLPADVSRNIPAKGLAWLGKAGLTEQQIYQYQIGYSESLGRVILPVTFRNIYHGFIARATESWQKPKYLEMCPAGVMWGSHSSSTVCVVVEDILSGIRCAKYISSYALLGTSLGTANLNQLMRYKRVLLWLDGDKAGFNGLLKNMSRLRLMTEVKIIRTDKDPKFYSNDEILERITQCIVIKSS